MTPRRRRVTGFTLVELLVVIGIIALLISILLPVISKVRATAVTASCKALLRQYTLATEMYINEAKGTCPDGYKYADYGAGIVRYFNMKELSEKVARCPGDDDVNLATLGASADPNNNPNPIWQMLRADGTPYTVRVSIGYSDNALSAGRRRTSVGYSYINVKRSYLRAGARDASRVMVWGDYQTKPFISTDLSSGPTPLSAIVNPGAQNTNAIGTISFRHRGKICNAAFLDGHVGELVATIKTNDSGTQILENWPAYGSFAGAYYPFGPRNNGGTWGLNGGDPYATGNKIYEFPGIQIR